MMKFWLGFVVLAVVCLHEALSLRPLSMYTRKPMYQGEGERKVAERRLRGARDYSYETIYATQRVDNFGWGTEATFQQKVLFSDKHFKAGGPILFYAGNEGDIELFVENSGYLWDLEEPLNGMVVFAEHRYYGVSMPFGKDTYKSRENLAFFTADQALADYAMLIRSLKANFNGTANSKVIVFGGSYGGMLASWMRMKYPDIVDGAIASSAPIWSFTWPCDSYARVVTQDFVKYGSDNCRFNIRKSWDVINDFGTTDDGQKTLARLFKTCNDSVSDVKALKAWLENAFATVAMVNYPYATDFLAPLPAWPIREMCADSGLNTDLTGDENKEKLLSAISIAVGVYYNYTGALGECVVITDPGAETCTEMTIPFCNTGVNDMFEESPWSDQDWSDRCAKEWFGVRPNLNWTEVSYWGKKIQSASNILFSNGLLDPWSAGGVMKSLSPSQPIVIIPDGAHHLELRAANPLDTPACKAARQVETSWIMRWIQDSPLRVDSVHA